MCFILKMLFLIFSVQSKLTKPKAMEPLAPTALRGPVPIPPQRATKTANSVGSGVNPPKSTSALPPNLNNSTLTNQTNPGYLQIHCVYGKQTFKHMCFSSHLKSFSCKLVSVAVTLNHLFLNFLFLKIQFNRLLQTLALRTTSTTLSKWRKRKTTRIA